MSKVVVLSFSEDEEDVCQRMLQIISESPHLQSHLHRKRSLRRNWNTPVMADKPVQRTSLKEKLEAFKVRAAGADKPEIGKAKGKEEML